MKCASQRFLLTRNLVVLFIVLSLPICTLAMNFSPEQLKTTLQRAGVQKIYKIHTLETPQAEYLLIYGGVADGNVEIFVFRDVSLRTGHFDLRLDWRSGTLPTEFLVMSGGPDFASIVNGATVVVFSGCMPHNCGSKAAAAVYSVNNREIFKGTYDASLTPPIQYSANALIERNSVYKHALDSLLQSHDVRSK